MHHSYRRLSAGLAALAVTAVTLVACSNAEDEAQEVLDEFLAGWASGELDEVPFIDPLGDELAAAAVAEQLAEVSGDLGELPPELAVTELTASDGLATAQVAVDWPLPGGAIWSYHSTVRLDEGDGGWSVIWNPAVVHPELTDGDQLRLQPAPAERGDILGAGEEPLMTMRPVKDIGVWPGQVEDTDALVADLADAFSAIDLELDETLDRLPDEISEARADDLRVPLVTLREDDYSEIADQLDRDDILVGDAEWYLAPTRDFAQALLGTVSPVTAEIMEEHPGMYQPGDRSGQGGLSQRYEEQLRGVPGQAVTVDRDNLELTRVEPVAGTDLHLTLDAAVQRAAETALAETDNPAALVALRVSDGEVLAVANTRGAQAHPVNTALGGSVAPGSTFKMIIGYGLLSTGVITLAESVACPAGLTVDGFTIGNAFSGDRGEIPFQEAIAISCNTTFAELAPRLGEDGPASAAAELGLGGDWDLGAGASSGSVPTGGSPLDQAQVGFGQGGTQVSPAAMAAATAAVARGAWLPPTLVIDSEGDGSAEPTPLDESAIADLQSALREVVRSGTGSALADTPGGDVYGKTGTAETADDDVTHAWFVGWQEDIAFAVFVEGGESGSGTAVPLADGFLRGLG